MLELAAIDDPLQRPKKKGKTVKTPQVMEGDNLIDKAYNNMNRITDRYDD